MSTKNYEKKSGGPVGGIREKEKWKIEA